MESLYKAFIIFNFLLLSLNFSKFSPVIFQAHLTYFLGIGDDYFSSLASLLAFTSSMFKNDSYSEMLEIDDTEIFGVGVRIYRPVNRTNQEDESQEQDLLPGLIYFHGGGWTLGSLGKLNSRAFICKWFKKVSIWKITTSPRLSHVLKVNVFLSFC